MSDPILSALHALCHHPAYDAACDACHFRRRAAWEHVANLGRHALGLPPRGCPDYDESWRP